MTEDTLTVGPKSQREARTFDEAPGASRFRSGRLLVDAQLAATARRLPDKAAIVTSEGETTYAELDRMVNRLANGLLKLGANPGEVVGVQLGNTVEHVALTYALPRAGLIASPFNLRWTDSEVGRCLDEAGARTLVSDDALTPEQILAAGSDDPVDVDVPETAPVHLRFTSGTSGVPKASLNNHRALAVMTMGIASEIGMREEEVHLAMAPLTHAAIYFLHTCVYAGGTTILREGFNPQTLWSDCEQHAVTSTLVVPTILAMALEVPGDAPTLRTVVSLGAPLAPTLKRRLAERFPEVGLHEMYGATELGLATNLRPVNQSEKPRSVGQARFGYEVEIRDDEGQKLPAGEVGTIYVRGLSSQIGYVGSVQPEPPPAELAADGWATVGDLGHLDDQGFLFISDRRSDLILSGGINVYPSEVENVLMKAPGVFETAVIGLTDPKWGRRVVACVVGDIDEAILDAHCREHLATYKVPKQYIVRDDLPKSPVGKVLRRALVEEYEPGDN